MQINICGSLEAEKKTLASWSFSALQKNLDICYIEIILMAAEIPPPLLPSD